jgi:hypothetical protein
MVGSTIQDGCLMGALEHPGYSPYALLITIRLGNGTDWFYGVTAVSVLFQTNHCRRLENELT